MQSPVRILHLDDNSSDAQLVAMTLEVEQEKFPTRITYVSTKDEYLAALTRKDFDIILSDYRMPGYDGDAALASAQEICPEIPFIMVTGELGEEFAIERLQRGATDYVLKDRVFRLVPAIKRALAEAENRKKRREAEGESQKRQAELSAVIHTMPGGVTVFDTEGNVVLVNEAEVQMLGYEDERELKQNLAVLSRVFEFFEVEGRMLPLEEWPASRIMRGETVVNLELKARRKDTGREWYFSISGQPVRDENGKQILSVVLVRDITERRKREEELRGAQQATREILESIRDPFYSLDKEWRFTYVNAKCEEFFHKRRVEMLGRNLWELFPELSGTESEPILKSVASTRTPMFFETPSVLKGVWVEVHVSPRGEGGISVLYRDISERKAQEEALRQSEEQFAATFRASPYPLALSRVSDGKFFDVNEALLALYGAGRDEVVGKTSLDLGIWVDTKERGRYIEQLQREGVLHDLEAHIGTRTHGERVVLLSVSLLKVGGEQMMLTIVNDITERKQAEEALSDVALFPEENPSPILRVSQQGVLLYANRASQPLLDEWRFHMGETMPELLAGPVREAFSTGRTVTSDVQLGSTVFSCLVVPIPERSYANLYARDVTERRRAERLLREANERYHALFDAIDEGFCVIEVIFNESGKSVDYRFLELNASFQQQTGLLNAQGKRMRDIAPAHEANWFEIYGRVALTGQAVRFQNQAAALNRHYDVFAFPWGKREERQVAVLFNDITARCQAEEELQKKNRELQAQHFLWQKLIEGIADEVWTSDAEGNVSLVRFGREAGTESTEIKDAALEEWLLENEVLRPDGSVRPVEESPLRRSLNGEIVRGEEIVRNRRTSETRIRQHSSVPIRDVEDSIVGAAAIVRDVTEARKAELEIRRLNEDLEERVKQRTRALERANKELEAFSYSVSHDLKAPLRLISGFAELLVRQGRDNLTDKQKESIATIQTQAAHMDDLIKALLEFSRLSRKDLQLVPVDTRHLVNDVVAEQRQVLGEEAGERVQVDIGDLPVVKADPVLLRMVFTNLLSNAFKFTRTVAAPKITIEAERWDGYYSFRVTDNGVGFPRGHTEKLFKVFQRLHGAAEFEGTGIGLANVRKIVERHGGQVCGDGEEGRGATFFFTLPTEARREIPVENQLPSMARPTKAD